MNGSEHVRLAWESLRTNKLRSFLTMLGIVLGVGAVISMVSIGTGAQARVEGRIASLGTHLLVVRPRAPKVNGVRLPRSYAASLTLHDASAISQQAPDVAAVAPEMIKHFQVVYGQRNAHVPVDGTTPAYLAVRNAQVSSGRFLQAVDLRNAALVCDLGARVASKLFRGAKPVGRTVKISQLPFTVIGVMAKKGNVGPSKPDNSIFVPATAAVLRLMGTSRVSGISAEARSTAAMTAATAEIARILEHRHAISNPARDNFVIGSQNNVLQVKNAVAGTFTLLLGGIACISLLVGGIGIMNIMLVSVTERTREIGIRKAIGATPRAILTQFLVEAILLSLVGGLLGIASGVAGARVVSGVAGWPTLVPVGAIPLAFGFSAAVGLFFGIYPARRAARLDPIVALRHE